MPPLCPPSLLGLAVQVIALRTQGHVKAKKEKLKPIRSNRWPLGHSLAGDKAIKLMAKMRVGGAGGAGTPGAADMGSQLGAHRTQAGTSGEGKVEARPSPPPWLETELSPSREPPCLGLHWGGRTNMAQVTAVAGF